MKGHLWRSMNRVESSVESLLLNVSHLLIDVLGEILDILGVDVAVIRSGNDTLGVVLVLDFHACKPANVDI